MFLSNRTLKKIEDIVIKHVVRAVKHLQNEIKTNKEESKMTGIINCVCLDCGYKTKRPGRIQVYQCPHCAGMLVDQFRSELYREEFGKKIEDVVPYYKRYTDKTENSWATKIEVTKDGTVESEKKRCISGHATEVTTNVTSVEDIEQTFKVLTERIDGLEVDLSMMPAQVVGEVKLQLDKEKIARDIHQCKF